MRIEVAKTLEGAVPDLAARQIIDRDDQPGLQRNDYAGGLNAAIDRLVARITAEGLPAPDAQRGGAGALGGLRLGRARDVLLHRACRSSARCCTGMLGRKLGALATGGGAGALAWWFSASLLIAGLAGAGRRCCHGGRARLRRAAAAAGAAAAPPIIWGGGGGGWGGGWRRFGGGGGGFSSGGGGDFGGGGASGDW